MKSIIFSLLLLACSQIICAAQPTTAPTPKSVAALPKYALVIGNGSYAGSKRNLKNPENDAKLIAQTLGKLGFEVQLRLNLDRSQFLDAVDLFANTLPDGATAFVYYAGHGMQIGGASYLIPVDMAAVTEQEVPLRAVSLKTLLERVSSAKSAVNLLVLDACRDNPFQPATPVKYRSYENLGLAPVQAPRGTMVAYSTQPGQLAADGQGSNSIYTAMLARVLSEPRLSLEEIFKRVNTLVRNKTRDDQIPWYESSLTEEYFLQPPEGVSVVAGRSLQIADAGNNTKNRTRGAQATDGAQKNLRLWYLKMSDYEWSEVDWKIQQRVKNMTEDEIPLLEHQALGGNVIVQTTLGVAYLEGVAKASDPVTGKVMRYKASNIKAAEWLRKAADAGFPVAQTVLGEMYYKGQGLQLDRKEARRLMDLASKTNYPRAKLNLMQLQIESGQFDLNSAKDAMGAVMRSLSTR